jgi:hypothetical protein
VPVDDREQAAGPEHVTHRTGETRAIGNAVKHVGEKHLVHRLADNSSNLERIRLDKCAVRNAVFHKSDARGFEQGGIDVDCGHVPRDFCDRQREPAIAAA